MKMRAIDCNSFVLTYRIQAIATKPHRYYNGCRKWSTMGRHWHVKGNMRYQSIPLLKPASFSIYIVSICLNHPVFCICEFIDGLCGSVGEHMLAMQKVTTNTHTTCICLNLPFRLVAPLRCIIVSEYTIYRYIN